MITAIDFSRLRNAEFLQFIANFSDLVGANNPADLNIVVQHTAFKSKLDEMSRLFKMKRSSPTTQELILLDNRRDKAINGLTANINSYCNHYDAKIIQAAELLTRNLNHFGTGIARLNFQAETSTLNGIIHDWETKPELTAAIEKLGHTGWVAELKKANQLFEQKYLQRTREYGAANPVTLQAKRKETTVAYYGLRKFIEASSVFNPSVACEKLISELNALIDQYNELIRTRLAVPATEQTAADPAE